MSIQIPIFGSAAPLRAGQFKPRAYQVEANAAIEREFVNHRSTMISLCTGGGKTVIFCSLGAQKNGALVVAHRESLIRQAAEKLSAATGMNVEIEKADRKAVHSNYVVASVQTLRGERLKRFASNFQHIPIVIIDECHRSTSKSYREIIAAFPNAKILGVTATADRSDGKALGAVFESVAFRYDLMEATEHGWLSPLKWIPVQSSIDISGISVRKQDGEMDFDQVELDDVVNQHAAETVRGIYEAIEQHGHPRMRMIVFTPGVKTAHACAAADNELRPGSAAVVDGQMEDRLKARVIERHRNGEILRLYNCNVLTEGHDDPELDAIFDTSKTKSRLKAMQRWGRVTRPWPGLVDALNTPEERCAAIAASPKPWGLVFDLAMNSGAHDVAGPLDLLAGKELSEGVKRKAKEIFDRKGGAIKDVIEEAEEEVRKERARARAARRLTAATKVNIGTPRSIFERTGIEFEQRRKLPTRPEDHSPRNMRLLMKIRGIPLPAGCTKRQASRLIGEDKKREKNGTCRLGGVQWLRSFGIDAWSMPSVVAKRIQQEIILNGRRPLTNEQLGPLLDRQPGEDDGE